MEPADDLSRVYALNPHEQLTYWTGAIAQNDVALENAIFRLAGQVVLQPFMARDALPQGFERLREAAKGVVKASRIPAALKAEAVGLLGQAKTVHRARTELVHDAWSLLEGSEPPQFVVAHALMGRGWPEDQGESRTPADFEAAARAHINILSQLHNFGWKVSEFFSDEATAEFVRTQIAARFVGGPLDEQFRAVSRVTDHGHAAETFTESGATYRRAYEGSEILDGVVSYTNLRYELMSIADSATAH